MSTVYIDLDGVLANMDKKAKEILGENCTEIQEKEWNILKEKCPNFYRELELMPSAEELWDTWQLSCAFSGANLKILTAIPRRINWYETVNQKREWVWEHFGKNVEVMFGPFAYDKQFYCRSNRDVLVDDMALNIQQWKDRGGMGFFYRDPLVNY